MTKFNYQEKMPLIHPGKTLERQFFLPLNLSEEQLAQDLSLPLYQLQDLTSGRSSITPEIAYRLSLYFQLEAEVFLNLQQHYDFEVWKDRLESKIEVIPYHQLYHRSESVSV